MKRVSFDPKAAANNEDLSETGSDASPKEEEVK